MRLQAKGTKEAGTTVAGERPGVDPLGTPEGTHPPHPPPPHPHLISVVWILGVRFHCSELPSLRSF